MSCHIICEGEQMDLPWSWFIVYIIFRHIILLFNIQFWWIWWSEPRPGRARKAAHKASDVFCVADIHTESRRRRLSYLSKPSCRIDLSHDEPEKQHKKVFRTAQRSSLEAKAGLKRTCSELRTTGCWLDRERFFNSRLMEEKACWRQPERKAMSELILKHYEDIFSLD